jgi:hypothetical protein
MSLRMAFMMASKQPYALEGRFTAGSIAEW